MHRMIEKMKELLHTSNVNHIRTPRGTLLLLQFLQFCAFFLILFFWRGLFIVFSLLLAIVTCVFLVGFAKIWRRYYSVPLFILLTLTELVCSIILRMVIVNS